MPAEGRGGPGDAAAGTTAALLAWYAQVRRDLPWRHTRDPYRILVSEVMSQQTQIDRVVPFYERFLARFPDEATLAAAPVEECHRLWKGLGYPSRVERLQAACQAVRARGAWPTTPEGLLELPGIGPYTAAAVACFAFGQPTAVVDTNVARVYARRDALALPVDRAALTRHAAQAVPPAAAIAWNNALMELGALVCTARAPRCDACPWASACRSRGDAEALARSATPLTPARARPDAAPARPIDPRLPRTHIVLGLIHQDGRYLVARRPAQVHLGGSWELPGGKRERGENDRVALARELAEELGAEVLAARSFLHWEHAYPDRALAFHCYRVRLFAPEAVRPLAATELRWVTPAELLALPFPEANAPMLARVRRYHRRALTVAAERTGT